MSDPHAIRRRRLLFRAEHRGFKEADLVIGGFARARLQSMTESELDEFEALLEIPDQDLYAWVVSREEAPEDVNGPVFRALAKSAHAVSRT
ncbi:succinate dehydrogenase assembly factor 2 [Hyphobacterium sp. HN65]|uniref:FAD assembly factor SdhE n=1 Tax=Hyphobacterium lacteum TaxID=3116575 RepID=A0ABU7LN07_9PROT|nr:succinate dehydrogenase assembly factor 2 [Hyphobacterium sp. HN65]MEE2524979.1 succinate dehydrogenase assembly factor 2 [Hyphobacterium sp. HN65]